MEKEIREIFDAWISNTFKEKTEIKRYLLTHERKNKVVDNLVYQIRLAEIGAPKAIVKHYKTLIEDIAKMFCRLAVQHAEEKALSSIERIRRITEADRMTQIEQEFEADQKEFLAPHKPKIYVPG